MGIFDKNKFDSVKTDWSTHWDFFKPLNSEFNFTVDAAADAENCKVERHWDEQTDAHKMIGNGWTVDVIAHIFSFLKGGEIFNNFYNENV